MGNWIHLCIDMQAMFAEQTPWHGPWLADMSPAIIELTARHPERNDLDALRPTSEGAGRDGDVEVILRKVGINESSAGPGTVGRKSMAFAQIMLTDHQKTSAELKRW
ncbi:hypothetical protein [Pararhizobium sp. PWRC1-1]|uniref:hypothetical protein n=1 Tax=Pararhizobium sp. PWRC1-1 TaxID=2804566 RepID=UPI003CFB00DD